MLGLLGRILAAVLEALGIAGTILSVVQFVQSVLMGGQGGSSYMQLSNEVGTTLTEVENGTYGLSALAALIATARTDILAAIAALPQVGDPVTISDDSSNTLADVIWGYSVEHDVQDAGYWNQRAFQMLYNYTINQGVVVAQSPYFWLLGNYDSITAGEPTGFPNPLASAILVDDTVFSWLQREAPTFAWFEDWSSTGLVAAPDTGSGSFLWICFLDDQKFSALKSFLFPSTTSTVAPVWPGVDGVILGDPIALDVGVTVPGPLDGVLVAITGVPANMSFFNFNGTLSYRYAGGVAFVDDNGDAEFPQNLGFTNAVYSPRSMAQAASALLRCAQGVTGTVTPWTLV